MSSIQDIYDEIADKGFAESTLRLIREYENVIQDGTKNFPRFNLPEHAGLCKGGANLIGASLIASYATASLRPSDDTGVGQASFPNWKIDEFQEQFIEQWAKASRLWVENSEQILTNAFGPMIAKGAEAKVYYRGGDTSVVKERASIYSTT